VGESKFRADDVGICLSTLHVEPHAFVPADVERLTRVAAAAGFPSLALQVHWVRGYGVEAMRALLDELGLTAGALEGAMTWSNGPDAASNDADELLDIAAALDVRVLHAANVDQTLDSVARAADGFATLCERASAHDIEVGLEFIPWYAIPDLETAWKIVRESGAGNGGICIDLMHWHRQAGGPDVDALRAIPGQHITYVQLSDAPAVATTSADAYMTECLTVRPVPGDGVIDIDTMLAAIAATGADPYVAFQVCNTELAASGADAMAARLRASAAALLRRGAA
jgi:sugar phosphate isomerase/epimerase